MNDLLMQNNRLAYCPLDIPKVSINIDVVTKLVDLFDTSHHEGIWKCLPLLGRVKSQADFRDAAAFEHAWEHRYDKEGTVSVHQDVYDYLKPIYEQIKLLPLIPTHAQILCQTKYVGRHYDLKHVGKDFIDDCPGFNDAVEPAGYKIQLNQLDAKSFFVCPSFEKPRVHIRFPTDTNTFVINEKTFPHGADMPPQPKYIVSIFGLIDAAAHKKLLTQSLSKYPDFAIAF